jgi:hypothetical protein
VIRFFVALLIFGSCTAEKESVDSDGKQSTAIAMEQTLQISAKVISIEKTVKKFLILAVIENETNIKSFSIGDTVSLYPNFIRREGDEIAMKDPENEHMAALQNLYKNSSFKASIKIRGQANDRFGLIMNWQK